MASFKVLLCTSFILLATSGNCKVLFSNEQPIQFPLTKFDKSVTYRSISKSGKNVTLERFRYTHNRQLILDLQSLELEHPPNPYPGFIRSTIVRCLSLRDNGINQMRPGSFDQLPNLQMLDLSKNRLAYCDFFDFGRCQTSLQTLLIEENQAPSDNLEKSIAKAGCFPQLERLYLRNNSLRILNFSLKESFPKLSSLYLSNNQLDTKSFIRDAPDTLSHLYLEQNAIFSLRGEVLRNLQSLYLDGNIVRSICYEKCTENDLNLKGASSLKDLSISNNKIIVIDTYAFADTRNLSILDISQNSINELQSGTFHRLSMLAEINLDGNSLSNIPDFSYNSYLRKLSVRHNKLTSIKRASFSNLRRLQCLRLGGNKIEQFDDDVFMDLGWLEQLDLSNNGLEYLPKEWMQSLLNLRVLDLRRNKIAYFEKLSLIPVPFFSSIYLQDNNVSYVNETDVIKYSENLKVYLETNCTRVQ